MAVRKTGEGSKTKKTSVDRDEIVKRAEAIYQERLAKNLPGNEEGDWLEAEKQLFADK